MKKVIKIKGMHCDHCRNRVEKSLNEIEGVTAQVNLKKEEALVELNENVSNETLKQAVLDAGYEVDSISEK